MALDPVTTRLPGSTDQRRHRGRSPHVPTASVPILIVFFSVVVCRRFEPGCQRPIHGSCRKAGRWLAVSHLVAIDPTSTPCQRRCNWSSFGISFSTSLSLLIEIRCCSDRLNPQTNAAIRNPFATPTIARCRRPRRITLACPPCVSRRCSVGDPLIRRFEWHSDYRLPIRAA